MKLDNKELVGLIGKEKYFVHRGTWKNDYEWRIQKVKVTGIVIDKEGREYAVFAFSCCEYNQPVEDLRDTLAEAKSHAIQEIKKEADRLIGLIQAHNERVENG